MFEFGDSSKRDGISFERELAHLELTDELVNLIDKIFSRFPDHIDYQNYEEITSAILELDLGDGRRMVMSSVYKEQQRLPAVAVGPASHLTKIDFSLVGDEGLLKKHGSLSPEADNLALNLEGQDVTKGDLIDLEWLLMGAKPMQV